MDEYTEVIPNFTGNDLKKSEVASARVSGAASAQFGTNGARTPPGTASGAAAVSQTGGWLTSVYENKILVIVIIAAIVGILIVVYFIYRREGGIAAPPPAQALPAPPPGPKVAAPGDSRPHQAPIPAAPGPEENIEDLKNTLKELEGSASPTPAPIAAKPSAKETAEYNASLTAFAEAAPK